ncbi:hypothetical protein J6590_069255 [Homalodisca vitripennis]|nr:hypothetical protein J6590_069255 [Homalodisca vitripennis]
MMLTEQLLLSRGLSALLSIASPHYFGNHSTTLGDSGLSVTHDRCCTLIIIVSSLIYVFNTPIPYQFTFRLTDCVTYQDHNSPDDWTATAIIPAACAALLYGTILCRHLGLTLHFIIATFSDLRRKC